MSEEQLSEIVAGLDWDLGFADGGKESKQKIRKRESERKQETIGKITVSCLFSLSSLLIVRPSRAMSSNLS